MASPWRAPGLIARGARRIDPLISRVIPLSQAADAVATPPRPAEVKVLIQP